MKRDHFQEALPYRGRFRPEADTGSDRDHQEQWFGRWPHQARRFLDRHRRPMVAICYAQSVDGSIATRSRRPLLLSGDQSMVLTHRLRAACDAIIIGINTLVADDPLLTVRLAAGASPQPIVLDSSLRIPLTARLLARTDRPCWLACTEASEADRIDTITARGGEVIRCRSDRQGRVDLLNLLELLGARGISSVMVEGGSQVISSFIEARLAEQMVITISPRLVGGLPVLDRPAAPGGLPVGLDPVVCQSCGPDFILWARPHWPAP